MLDSMLASAGAGLLLDLAAYSTDTEGNAAQHYPAYAFAHPPVHRGHAHVQRLQALRVHPGPWVLQQGKHSYMDADYVKKAARDLGRELESIRKGA